MPTRIIVANIVQTINKVPVLSMSSSSSQCLRVTSNITASANEIMSINVSIIYPASRFVYFSAESFISSFSFNLNTMPILLTIDGRFSLDLLAYAGTCTYVYGLSSEDYSTSAINSIIYKLS